VVNKAGASFNVTGDGLRMFGSSDAQFLNEGDLAIKLGDLSQNVQFDGPAFINQGTVLVEIGTARFGGGGVSAGSFEVAADGKLNFSGGTHLLEPSSSVTGSNVEFSFKDSGRSTTIQGNYNVENTTISGNTAIFDVLLSQTGTLTHTGGFLDGIGDVIVTGKTTLADGFIQSLKPDTEPQAILLTLGGLEINGNFLTIIGNRRILNAEVANWTSGGIILNNILTRFENAEGATFNITGNATKIQGQGNILGGSGDKGLFVNRGDVVVNLNDDVNPVLIDTPFANLGRIDLQSDKLTFGDDLLQFDTGSLLFDIGGLDVFDTLHITGSAALDGVIDIALVDASGPGPAVGDTFDILTANVIVPFTEGGPGVFLGGPDGDKFAFEIVDLDAETQAIRLTFVGQLGLNRHQNRNKKRYNTVLNDGQSKATHNK
jgi:hypothetical protein